MAFQLSPGVSVTEKDLTTIVPTVATTAAGMAGLFEWGPVGLPVTISSVQELGTLFGMPRDGNADWWFTAYNYLGYGNNLKIVRHVSSAARNATVGTKTPALIRTVDSASISSVATVAANGAFGARYPGELGNSLWVEICGSSLSAAGEGATFGSWQWNSLFSGRPTTSAYSDRLGIAENDAFHLVVVDYDGKFTGTPLTVLEKYENISVHPGAINSDGTPLFYKTKINDESRYIVAIGTPSTFDVSEFAGGMTAWGNHTATWTNATSYQTGGNYFARMSGGTGQFTGESTIVGAIGEGYDVFGDADTIDVNLVLGGPLTGNNAQKLCDIAKNRKDCVAFVSSPNKNPAESAATKISNCITLRNAVGNNNYAFIDSGYKYMYDPFNDTYRYIPLNGDVAGLCARTDVTNDPWWSPAGFNRGQIRNTIKLAFNPTKTERDNLYSSAINPVVTFSGEGTVLYGDKTAQTRPSAFDRINVRRLFIVLEKAIATAAKYSLFEYNDAFTRSQFRSLVEPFLRDVQSRRGITDFKVVCDEKNNTPQVIDSNQFVADIYVKPNRSINFIQLNFVATKSGVSFEEVGA